MTEPTREEMLRLWEAAARRVPLTATLAQVIMAVRDRGLDLDAAAEEYATAAEPAADLVAGAVKIVEDQAVWEADEP